MDAPDATRFILIGTSHPANVGAAARAMKVMGFSDLVLVAPRHADVHRRDEAVAMASGAVDLADEIVRALDADLQQIDVECRAVDDRARRARRLDGDIEHGMERLRHGRCMSR